MIHTPQLNVFNFSVKNQDDETVDIYVDGYIYDSPTKEMIDKYWGEETSTSFKSFREQVPANVKTINLNVNSGGGHVGDAMAIHDWLKELEGKGVTVNRKGRGIVASAATYLVMGNNSEMSENSWFMIHEVSGFAYGNVTQVENQAKALRKFNDRIVAFYSNSTGLSETVINNMMNKETWLTAEEAKEKGFVKNVSGSVSFSNSIKPEQWPFTNTTVLNAYNSFTNTNPPNMDMKKITDAINTGFNSLLEKLNLKGKESDETVKNAFTDFSNSITNALKEMGTPDETAIQNMVNTAVTEAVKNIGENEGIKNAIAEATKNSVTKDDLTEATKNSLTKDDLKSFKEEITNAIAGKIGNKQTEKKEPEGGGTRKVKNRFSNAEFWENN